MGGGQAKRKREAESYWDAQARQANQAITQVDPLEAQWRQQQQDYLNWRSSDGRDVAEAPGLSEYIQIGQAAQDRAKQERMGTGALQLGNAANAGHVANLKTLRQNEAAQDFGTGLERAQAMRHAEATGSVMPLASLFTNRNVAQAQNAGSMFGQWSARPQPKNWWDYAREGVGFAQSVGSMIFGGG